MFITLAALAILVLRVRYPEVVKIDAISIALIAVAVLPWLRSIVKSVEVAGLGKLELQDVERAARKVEDAGLPKRGEADGDAAGTPGMESGNGPGGGAAAPEPAQEPSPAQADSGAHPAAGTGTVEPQVAGKTADPTAPTSDPERWWRLATHSQYREIDPIQRASYNALNSIGASLLRDSGLLTPDQAFTLLDGALRDLAAEYGVTSYSRAGSVRALTFMSALDGKQADAVLTAFNLLNAARHGVSSGLARTRAVDVALEVADSLNVIRTRAAERKQFADRLRRGSQGGQERDAAGDDVTDPVEVTNRAILEQAQKRNRLEGEG